MPGIGNGRQGLWSLMVEADLQPYNPNIIDV